jgi:hypothetical protein
VEKSLFILVIIIISLLANFIWENFHSSFYKSYRTLLNKTRFSICTLVDSIIVSLLYTSLAFILKDFFWIRDASYKSVILTIIGGGVVAIIIEKVALLLNLWGYKENMPKIPLLNVGLWPVLQLMILPILTYFISYFLFNRLFI